MGNAEQFPLQSLRSVSPTTFPRSRAEGGSATATPTSVSRLRLRLQLTRERLVQRANAVSTCWRAWLEGMPVTAHRCLSAAASLPFILAKPKCVAVCQSVHKQISRRSDWTAADSSYAQRSCASSQRPALRSWPRPHTSQRCRP
jgi:hypothetical protein